MPAPDPDFWQEATKWLAGVLILPLGYVWKKVNNAVQKADFEKHQEKVRGDIRDLYRNAEADRKLVRDGFDELTKTIHNVHVDLLEKIGERK